MEWAFTYGKMGASMKDNIKTIRNTVLESTYGVMVGFTQATGRRVNSMDWAFTQCLEARKRLASGRRASELSGSIRLSSSKLSLTSWTTAATSESRKALLVCQGRGLSKCPTILSK